MAGLNRGRVPRFVERYGDLGGVLADAAVRFFADVRAGGLPGRGALLQLISGATGRGNNPRQWG
jgi:ketopantoate hydroxymethyltransferase